MNIRFDGKTVAVTGAGHGFGVRPSHHASVDKWPEHFLDWLGERGFLKKE